MLPTVPVRHQLPIAPPHSLQRTAYRIPHTTTITSAFPVNARTLLSSSPSLSLYIDYGLANLLFSPRILHEVCDYIESSSNNLSNASHSNNKKLISGRLVALLLLMHALQQLYLLMHAFRKLYHPIHLKVYIQVVSRTGWLVV